MKFLLDKKLELTRGDYAGNQRTGKPSDIQVVLEKNAIVTHTPATLFNRYGFDVVEAEMPENAEVANSQYHDFRNKILNDTEIQKQIDQKFLMAIRHGNANFDEILLEKVTYQLDANEKLDEIVKVLNTMSSNALFRAYAINEEENTITTYASREGIWEIEGILTAKSAELRSAGAIRTDRAYRSVKDPTKFIDAKRANYPLLEETKALIEGGAIKYSYASREQADGTFKDDSPAVYVTELHFKESLNEDDIEKLQTKTVAAQIISKETTHVNKPQASMNEASKSLEKNEKEIHTKHTPVTLPKIDDNELKKEKEDALKSFMEKSLKKLEEKQKLELEIMQQKIQNAMGEEREKAKNTFLTSLSNGMTVGEAIDNLKSAKHNDFLVEVVLEDVKNEIILTSKKSEIIEKTKNQLGKTTEKLSQVEKRLEKESQANKTNHNNYTLELNKRKEAEIAIDRLVNVSKKMGDEIAVLKGENLDLKDENREKDIEIREQTKELEEQFNEISKRDNEITKLKDENQKLVNLLNQANIEKATMYGRLEETSKQNESLAQELSQTKDENQKINERLQNAKIEYTKVKSNLDVYVEKNQDLTKELISKNQKINELDSKIESIKTDFEKEKFKSIDLAKQIAVLQKENELFKEEFLSFKNSEKSNTNSNLVEQFSELEELGFKKKEVTNSFFEEE